jgi:hypothetical protein
MKLIGRFLHSGMGKPPSAYTASSLLKSVSVNDLEKVLVTRLANNTQVEPIPKDASLYDTLKIELKNLIIKQFENTVSKENESSAQEITLKN